MNGKGLSYKILLIGALVIAITAVHFGTRHGHLGLHLLHRELYFIPILLASFWFGLKTGLATSLIVSVIYAPHVIVYDDSHGVFLTVLTQIFIFNLVAVILGWLVDRQRQNQKEMLAVENLSVLGRAAVAVGHEMNDIIGAMKRLIPKEKKIDEDLGHELARLEKMADVLSSFIPVEQVNLISHDLNMIIQNEVAKIKSSARKSGITIALHLDERGCPSKTDMVKFEWVIKNLIKNAMEVSTSGQTVHIRSKRGGEYCEISVQDEGPGIRPEHLGKIFTPFFTTKPKGHGLALAVCNKLMKELGGNIQVKSQWGEGTVFKLMVPRDSAR